MSGVLHSEGQGHPTLVLQHSLEASAEDASHCVGTRGRSGGQWNVKEATASQHRESVGRANFTKKGYGQRGETAPNISPKTISWGHILKLGCNLDSQVKSSPNLVDR